MKRLVRNRAALVIWVSALILAPSAHAFHTQSELDQVSASCAEKAGSDENVYFSCLESAWNQSLARSLGEGALESISLFSYTHEQPGPSRGMSINMLSTFNWSLNECALRWGAWPLPLESTRCLFERFKAISTQLRTTLPRLKKEKAERDNAVRAKREAIEAALSDPFPTYAGFPMCGEILERIPKVKALVKAVVDPADSVQAQASGLAFRRATAQDYIQVKEVHHYETVTTPVYYYQGSGRCILEGTEVLALSRDQSSSRSVPIQSIEVGDYILSNPLGNFDVDPNSYLPCWAKIVDKRPRELEDGEEILHLTFRAKGSTTEESITATATHPFFVSRDGGEHGYVVTAGELKQYKEGKPTYFVAIPPDPDVTHTYSVLTGNWRLSGEKEFKLLSPDSSGGQPLCFFSDSTGFVCPIQSVAKNNIEDRWFFQHWTWVGGSKNPSVYDLTIEGTHTFYVKDPKGKTFILVHNKI